MARAPPALGELVAELIPPSMKWMNEPATWSGDEHELRLTTAPRTDIWRETHYGFVRDSGHFWYREVRGDFLTEVSISGAYRDQYDQAGLMVRRDARTWLKCGIEFVDGHQLASTVITKETSDWAVVPIVDPPERFRIVVERRAAAVFVRYGPAENEQLLRLASFADDATLQVGVMAASPNGNGCEFVLRNFAVETRPPASQTA